MPFKIEQKERESSQNITSRFLRRVRGSRFIFWLRKKRFRKRVKSHQSKKKAALRREELRKKYKEMEKLGEIKR